MILKGQFKLKELDVPDIPPALWDERSHPFWVFRVLEKGKGAFYQVIRAQRGDNTGDYPGAFVVACRRDPRP